MRAKLDTVDSTLREHIKNFNAQAKAWTKQMSEARSSAKAPRAKRKPSEYNLYLKDKMKQGMTMTEAVQAWKQRGSGTSSSSSMSGSSMSSSMSDDDSESGAEEEEA